MKIAIVTGGSRGLGRSTALKLSEAGVGVLITYKSKKDDADEVVRAIEDNGGKAASLPLDVARVKDFPVFIDAVRGVLRSKWDADRFDFLVNNAGVGGYVPITEVTEDFFDEMMNVHFKGVFFLTQKLLPLLNDGGRIINVSSGLARFAMPGSSVYGSMKGAVEVLTRYLAKELGPRGIAVNVVAPGPIETDFGGGRVRDNKEMNAFLKSQTSLGRVGVADDIGGLIASLLGEGGRWVNAQRIEASGGIFY